MEYKKNVSEPWFSLISLNIKRVEGRLGKGDFAKMKKGDMIIFENTELGILRTCKVKITSICNYETFHKYLEKETLRKCLPTIESIDIGVGIYYKYFTKEDEKKYKIIAIRMKLC